MSRLAERLLKTIRKTELLRAGDRVAAAVSGGADSVALLLLLAELRGELGIVLSVAHVNHKLRGVESDEDEAFTSELAARLGLEFDVAVLPIGKHDEDAGKKHGEQTQRGGGNLEAAARDARYEFFRGLAERGRVSKIAAAHTLDDQAETVLLRMFRGTGIRGLGGVRPRLQLEDGGRACGEVVRPLLGFRRAELREYLLERGQSWREDSSNEDVRFLRNRVRRKLVPMIREEFGDAAIEHMAELAEIARAEEEWIFSIQYSVPNTQKPVTSAQYPVPTGQKSQTGKQDTIDSAGGLAPLDVKVLLTLPLAAARRTVRGWIETKAPQVSVSFRLIEEILELARGAAGKTIELPGGASGENVRGESADLSADVPGGGRTDPPADPPNESPRFNVRRTRDELVLERAANGGGDYEYVLPVPGEAFIRELGVSFAAEIADADSVPEGARDGLLDAAAVGASLVIRNWRAGDRYRPAHTKEERKVKELLNDRHVTGGKKKLWPVAVCRGELVWVRGFAAPKAWQPVSRRAIWIRER